MWSAAILIGGKAARFDGRDKSALLVRGRSFLSRQLQVLAEVAGDVMIVGGPLREAAGPARFVADHIPGCGPLGGLHAALTEAVGDAVAVVACDMPYINAPLLLHLLTLTCEADVVVPRSGRGYHPLCAAYTKACLAPVTRRLQSRQLKMADLFDDLRTRVITAEEVSAFGHVDELLANVNTPDEYVAVERLDGHKQ